MPTDPEARALEMRKLRLAGKTFDEIGDLYGVTGVRVLQILQQLGGDTGTRARRRPHPDDLLAAVRTFLASHRDIIANLATSGASRFEVVERFRLFMPETDLAVIAQSVTESGVLFDVDAKVVNFSPAAIAGAVWHVFAVSLGLDCDRLTALRAANLQEARETSEILRAQGLDENTVAQVLCRAACARAYARGHPEASLTRERYEQLRRQIIQELGLQSGQGTASWPPTGLTVMKRLGGGYWADALSRIGLAPSAKGRARGPVKFDGQDYEAAVAEYVEHVTATWQVPTKDGYQEWVDAEQRAGRHKPSFATVRLRYGTWTAAMRIAAARTPLASQSPKAGRSRTPLSTKALHDASQELNRFLAKLGDIRPAAASALVEQFIKAFAQEFEYRRREWLRTMLLLDDSVVPRLLADSSVDKKIRAALSRTPPDLSAIQVHRSLDGGVDPRRTEGWLRPDAQAVLDAVPDEVAELYKGLREARNYLTHTSAGSRDRLSAAIQQISSFDPRFELKQPLTPRVLIDWLRAKDAQRLRLLSSCVPALWGAMVDAESILAEPWSAT